MTMTPTTITMTAEANLLRLLTLLSPAFPVGAFGYSHGLETAIREGMVTDRETLCAWISGLIEHGGGWSDAVLFKAAWEAADDAPALGDLADLAAAMPASLERRRETLGQGEAFLTAAGAWGPVPLSGAAAYPVAVGAVCGQAAIALDPALTAWLHAFAANLVSVAVRAIPIGQIDGVAAIAVGSSAVSHAALNSTASLQAPPCSIRPEIQSVRVPASVTMPSRIAVSSPCE